MSIRWLGTQEEKVYGAYKDLLSANTEKIVFPKKVLVTISPASTYFEVGMKILIIDDDASEENSIAVLPGLTEITLTNNLTNDYTTAKHAKVVLAPNQSLPHTGLDIQPDQGFLEVAESIQRMKLDIIPGPFVGNGTTNLLARADNLGWLLKWLFGAVDSVQIGTSAMYKHTFTPAPTIRSFVAEDVRELSIEGRYLSGTLMKSMALEAPAREIVTQAVSLQYRWEEIIKHTTVGAMPSVRPFVFYDGSVSLVSPLADVEAFTWAYENDIPDDTHDVGSRKLPSPIVQGMTLTGDLELKWKSWAIRQKYYGALVGAAEPKEPQTERRSFALVLTLTGSPTGVVDKPNYELVLTMPSVVLKENPAGVTGIDRLVQTVSWEAIHDAGIKAELYNKEKSYEGVVPVP